MYVCVLHCLFSRATTQVFVVIGPIANSKGRGGFPGGSDGKESACNVGDLGLIPVFGRSPGEGCGTPLQYSCLENPRGQRSLEGCSPRGPKECNTTKHTAQKVHQFSSLSFKLPKSRETFLDRRCLNTIISIELTEKHFFLLTVRITDHSSREPGRSFTWQKHKRNIHSFQQADLSITKGSL